MYKMIVSLIAITSDSPRMIVEINILMLVVRK